jgi:hypothetical protein
MRCGRRLKKFQAGDRRGEKRKGIIKEKRIKNNGHMEKKV